MTLFSNLVAFCNAMRPFRRDVLVVDKPNECLIEDWLQLAKGFPLMLLRLNFRVNRAGALAAISEFEQWFQGVEVLNPDPYCRKKTNTAEKAEEESKFGAGFEAVDLTLKINENIILIILKL